jgi:DNA processing protein
MNDARLQLAFAGLHPERARELRGRFGGAEGALRAIGRAKVKASEHVREAAGVDASTRREQLKELGVSAMFRGELDYPAHLDRYEDAPDLLFVRGQLAQQPGVAIVGTRRCTAYGRELARAYGRAAAEAGWPVVSGLARGIDGEAHRGMVDAGGVGTAVLGCGIDIAYPREHQRLGQQILDAGGAIVTEYPPGSPPDGWRFPPRKRKYQLRVPHRRIAPVTLRVMLFEPLGCGRRNKPHRTAGGGGGGGGWSGMSIMSGSTPSTSSCKSSGS